MHTLFDFKIVPEVAKKNIFVSRNLVFDLQVKDSKEVNEGQSTNKEDAMQEGLLVPITMFVSIAVVSWKHIDSRHRERTAIIEKGLNPSDYMQLYKHQSYAISPLSNLKWGLVAIFAGLGTLTAEILTNWYHYDEGAIFPGVILVFGGIGLILFYLVASKKMKDL